MEKVVKQLNTFIELEKEARACENLDEFSFAVCNLTKKLFSYHQAIFWTRKYDKVNIHTVSGTAGVDKDSPYIVWLGKTIQKIEQSGQFNETKVIHENSLDEKIKRDWDEWLPEDILWSPFLNSNGETEGGMIFIRDIPWENYEENIASEICSSYKHAYLCLIKKSGKKIKRFVNRRTRYIKFAALALIIFVFLIPVKQSVLAPAEIVAREPILINSPLNAVIEEIYVNPNQKVSKGDLLFKFDETELKNRYETAQKQLSVSIERLRKASQHAFSNFESKSQVEILKAEVEIKKIEQQFVSELLRKVEVKAPQDGVIIFGRKNDWIGKPVVIGEQVMQLANPGNKEIDIFLPVADAITFNQNSDVLLYPHAYPLDPLEGNLLYASHKATNTAEGTLAYHIKVKLAKDKEFSRIGMKGTAKIFGKPVTLFYYIFRKPLGAVRRTLGI